MSDDIQDGLINSSGAARICGVSVATIQDWETKGLLKAEAITPGGHRRFRRTTVEEFARSFPVDNRDRNHPHWHHPYWWRGFPAGTVKIMPQEEGDFCYDKEAKVYRCTVRFEIRNQMETTDAAPPTYPDVINWPQELLE